MLGVVWYWQHSNSKLSTGMQSAQLYSEPACLHAEIACVYVRRRRQVPARVEAFEVYLGELQDLSDSAGGHTLVHSRPAALQQTNP